MNIKYFIAVMFLCIMASGCTNGNDIETMVSHNRFEGAARDERETQNENLNIMQDGDYINNNDSDNSFANEVLEVFLLENDVEILNIVESNDGYVALLIFDNSVSNETFNIIYDWGGYVKFLIFDTELELVEELFITDEIILNNWLTLTMTSDIIFRDGELIIYYVESQRAMWDFGSGIPYLRRYNVHTKETENVFKLDDENLIINGIKIVSNDLIFFNANHTESQGNMFFGFIDLASEEKIVYYEEFNRGYFVFSGNYVLFTEAPDQNYLIPGQINSFVLSQGRVFVLNVETKDVHYLFLPGLESMYATLSKCGQFVVTIDDGLTLFKKYDITTGELIFEYEIIIEGEVFTGIEVSPNGDYELLSFTLLKDEVIDDVEYQEIAEFRLIVSNSEVFE